MLDIPRKLFTDKQEEEPSPDCQEFKLTDSNFLSFHQPEPFSPLKPYLSMLDQYLQLKEKETQSIGTNLFASENVIQLPRQPAVVNPEDETTVERYNFADSSENIS